MPEDVTMRVAVSGTSGLIGGALARSLADDGHRVHRLVRDRASATGGDVYWSPGREEVDAEGLEGIDAVVHLAGEPIDTGSWSSGIRDSRVIGTRLVAEALASLDRPPRVLVSGSAVGFYGSRDDEVLTETSSPGSDFLAETCVAWERAAQPAAEAGIRVVHPRTGVVIAADSPLIDKVELPFRLGVGGRVGSGRQWYPWISLADQVAALRFLVASDLSGPVNLAAPTPVTNAELTRALGEVLRRPTVLPIPVLAVRLLYGEVGETLATASQRAVPERLLDAGFEHTHTDLRDALRVALDRG